MHPVGFIIRTYHDARSPERQITFFTSCRETILTEVKYLDL